MSVEFDSPANRIIQQLQPKNKFRIDTSLPDLPFLRQLSLQGRLWYEFAKGSATATDVIIRTPASGTTDFISQIIINCSGVAANTETAGFKLEFFNDGNPRFEIFQDAFHTTTIIPYMDSITGDGMKAFTVNATETGTATFRVTMLGWTENTSRIRDVTS